MRLRSLLCCLTLLFASGAAPAQTANTGSGGNQTASPAQPPSFPELFPSPTHNNGYEEWVQAADLIQNNADVDVAVDPGATLSFKRKVLAETSVVQALRLLREGLEKPIGSPRKTLDENTRLPELSEFRKLARLLTIEQYVDFSEGRVDAAIDSLQVGLAFGYRIQTDTVIGGLVGLAIDSVVT